MNLSHPSNQDSDTFWGVFRKFSTTRASFFIKYESSVSRKWPPKYGGARNVCPLGNFDTKRERFGVEIRKKKRNAADLVEDHPIGNNKFDAFPKTPRVSARL